MTEEAGGAPDDIQLYLRASEQLFPKLVERIKDSNFFQAPLTYRGRVKAKKSIEGKIAKRRRLDPAYGIKELTDLVGIRFVTMLRMGVPDVALGIPDVTEKLLFLLGRPGNGELGDFGSATLQELKLFLCHPPQKLSKEGDWLDDVYDALCAQLEEHGPAVGLHEPGKVIRQQYSGVHLVVKFRVAVDGRDLIVPVEIQVRSVFEDAWGETDHRLFYKSDREALFAGGGPRSNVRAELGILKAMLDNAEQLAASISEKSKALAKLEELEVSQPDILPNLDPAKYPIDVAGPITYRRDLVDEYLQLVRAKETIDKSGLDRSKITKEYAGLAKEFERLFEKENGFASISIDDVPPDQRERIQALAFLLLMDRAVCHFLQGLDDAVAKAIELYEEITSPDPVFPGLEGRKHPTAWFRLGEAKNWMIETAATDEERESRVSEAYEAFAEARRMLSATAETDSLVIDDAQRAYLDQSIERLQGFALWRLSDIRRKNQGKAPQPRDIEQVRQAWQVVEKRTMALAPPFSHEDLYLHNTATYFAVDGVLLCEHLGQEPTGFPTKATIRTMLDTLDAEMKQLGFQEERFAHTRMYGADLLGDSEGAVRAAWQVLDAHVIPDRSLFSPYQKDMHDRVAREALEVISRFGGRPCPAAESSSER